MIDPMYENIESAQNNETWSIANACDPTSGITTVAGDADSSSGVQKAMPQSTHEPSSAARV
jgi:hypothetical protein